MKKLLLIAILLSFVSSFSYATHAKGGDVRITQIGPNQYQVNLTFIREFTVAQTPSSINGGIRFNSTDSLVTSVLMNKDSAVWVDNTCVQGGFLVEINYYSGIVFLANDAAGYYFSWTHCCNVNPVNIASGEVTFTATFPNPAIPRGNSSPYFKDNFKNYYLCINTTKQIDYSCIDPDGDSLVYSLIPPSNGGLIKPFNPTNWSPGYSMTNIINGVCTIDTNGIVTLTPYALGNFVVAVKCEEYRNGIKIGEVIRELELPSANCFSSAPVPFFKTLCGTYTTASGKKITQSGVFYDTVQTFLGCDSILELNLTIRYLDTSTTFFNPYIESNDTTAIYQWLNCDSSYSPIQGANRKSFTIPANGSYAVQLTKSGCRDTSACFSINNVGINEKQLLQNTKIYPNPTTGTFTLDLGEQTQLNRIFLTDLNGRLIKEITPQNVSQYEISFDGFSGVYFLNLVGENSSKTLKIIKQ